MPAVEDRIRSLPSSVAGSGAGSKKDMMNLSVDEFDRDAQRKKCRLSAEAAVIYLLSRSGPELELKATPPKMAS